MSDDVFSLVYFNSVILKATVDVPLVFQHSLSDLIMMVLHVFIRRILLAHIMLGR